jgi:uncharacterized protein YdaU (DUF1376 family)
MSKKRWFRLYIERWRDGTFGLTPNEIAAYITILCELYDHDGIVIRPDLDIMARRCGMRPTSFRKAFDELARRGKLSLEGDVLTSKAVSGEIESREKLDEKSAESRKNLAGKRNDIRQITEKIPSNTEERIQNNTTFKVSALPPGSQALEERTKSPAVAGFIRRREMRARG